MRKSLTPAEATLWASISNKQLGDRKFRRQHGIGKYIVDFYCPSEKLVVELDGHLHFQPGIDEYDLERDRFISNLGITVLRFENQEVWDDLDRVLERIKKQFRY